MYKEFIKLTIPNILTNLTVPLVSLVDVALMGHYGNADYIVALGLAVAVFNMVYWAFGFLRMGTTGQIAQLFGKADAKAMQKVLLRGVLLALIIGLIFLLIQWPLLQACEMVMNVSSETFELLSQYFSTRIYAAPATIALFVTNGWLLGIQKSTSALVLAIIINAVNIVLSYVLVQFFELGIEGVAAGTLVAQYTGLVVGLGLIYKEYRWDWLKSIHSISKRDAAWKEFIQVNSDLFIRTLCLLLALTFFKVKAAEMEVTIGAANLLLLEFIAITAFGIDGLAFAAESISGKYFGAGEKNNLLKSVKVAFQIGLGISAVMSLVFWMFSTSILNLLTNQQEIIQVAQEFLPWVIIAPVVHSVAFIWDGIYIGCTASKQMKWTLLISTFVIFLPSYYLLEIYFGNHGIWLALTLFMAARGVLQTFWVERGIYSRL